MICLPIEWTEFQIEINMVGVSFSGDQAALKSWRTLKGGEGVDWVVPKRYGSYNPDSQ